MKKKPKRNMINMSEKPPKFKHLSREELEELLIYIFMKLENLNNYIEMLKKCGNHEETTQTWTL